MGADEEQGLAAVGVDAQDTAGLGTDDGQHHIDGCHEGGGEEAGLHNAAGEGTGGFHTQAPEGIDEDDAEGHGGQGVHGIIAVQEALEEAHALVVAQGLAVVHAAHGVDDGGDGQDGQEHQEDGVEDLAHPGEDAGGLQREVHHDSKEQRRKHQQHQGALLLGDHGQDAHGEGDGGGTGDGEQRPDGQVQHAGVEVAEAAADQTGHLQQVLFLGHTHGGHAQQGQAHTRQAEADDSGDDIGTCVLTHEHGEDQVAGTEEHTKEHRGQEYVFLCSQFVIHNFLLTQRRDRPVPYLRRLRLYAANTHWDIGFIIVPL